MTLPHEKAAPHVIYMIRHLAGARHEVGLMIRLPPENNRRFVTSCCNLNVVPEKQNFIGDFILRLDVTVTKELEPYTVILSTIKDALDLLDIAGF